MIDKKCNDTQQTKVGSYILSYYILSYSNWVSCSSFRKVVKAKAFKLNLQYVVVPALSNNKFVKRLSRCLKVSKCVINVQPTLPKRMNWFSRLFILISFFIHTTKSNFGICAQDCLIKKEVFNNILLASTKSNCMFFVDI